MTYQFQFGTKPVILVVDISASSRAEAVTEMRLVATEIRDSEDPYDLNLVRDYVRVWVTIDPRKITEENIVDEWEDA